MHIALGEFVTEKSRTALIKLDQDKKKYLKIKKDELS